MLISTEIGSLKKWGDKTQILKLLKDTGFTAYDFSFFDDHIENLKREDYKEFAKKIREYSDEIGLPCNQSHAPFPSAKIGDEKYNREIFPYIVRAIEFSGILGAKAIVIHPCNDYCAEQNAEFYLKLLPYAKENNIKICLENMWNWEVGAPTARKAACSHHDDFKRHLDLVPSDVFGACLDIGHAEMAGLDTSAETMIKTLDKRLIALHIHDNDKLHDDHALPFTYRIDFDKVLTALKEVGYNGDITFESGTYFYKTPRELLPTALKHMSDIGRYFIERIK